VNLRTGVCGFDFGRRLKLEFHGSRITTDAGLLAYRELDNALGLTDMVGDGLVDPRTGKNGRHALTGLFRQSVFGCLGGYEDVNDAIGGLGSRLFTAISTNSGRISSRTALKIASTGDPNYCLLANWRSPGECRIMMRSA